MNLVRADELERLVRATFPGKRQFSAGPATSAGRGCPYTDADSETTGASLLSLGAAAAPAAAT